MPKYNYHNIARWIYHLSFLKTLAWVVGATTGCITWKLTCWSWYWVHTLQLCPSPITSVSCIHTRLTLSKVVLLVTGGGNDWWWKKTKLFDDEMRVVCVKWVLRGTGTGQHSWDKQVRDWAQKPWLRFEFLYIGSRQHRRVGCQAPVPGLEGWV